MLDSSVLKSIAAHSYAVPAGDSVQRLLPEITEGLGSPVSDLRETSLDVLWEWTTRGTLSDDQLVALGEQMVGNLLGGLGEKDTDSVFLRAFSGLIVGLVVAYDQARFDGELPGQPFLTREQVLDWLQRSMIWYQAEADLRGYVTGGKGWAHAAAHGADMLRDMACSRHLGSVERKAILGLSVERLLTPAGLPWLFNECERLAVAVYAALLRLELEEAELMAWLAPLTRAPGGMSWRSALLDGTRADYEEGNRARVNVKDFLRSLFFQVKLQARHQDANLIAARRNYMNEVLLPVLEWALMEVDGGSFYQV
jgi:hypothetical protein